MDTRTTRLIHLLTEAQKKYSKDYMVIPLPNFLAKKFLSYCSMKEDLETILEYTKLLRTDISSTIKSALSHTLISLYGKCFTDASKHGNPKLEALEIFKNEEEHEKTHLFLMDLRHQFVAHRGETDAEIGIAFMIIPKPESNAKSQLRFSQLKQNNFSEDLERIRSLIDFVMQKVMEKVEKSGQRAYEGMFNAFDAEQLVLLMINNAKIDT